MATLIGSTWLAETGKLVDASVTIDPVTPILHGPRDAYHIRLGPNSDGLTWESTLVFEGYYGAHDEFKFVAEMFREAEAVSKLPSLVAGASRTAVTYETGWADVQLIKANTRREPDRIQVEFSVRDLIRNGPNPAWLHGRCTTFYLITTVEEARRFGEDLLGQLIAAWQKRREMGISVDSEDECWPAYFADDPRWSAYFETDTAGDGVS